MARSCRCGGILEMQGDTHLDNDGLATESTSCSGCGVESHDSWSWADGVFGDLHPAGLVDQSLRTDLAGRDVCVVATEGPDPRLLTLPALRENWTRQPYPRADDGGPFVPDTEEDDLAPASHFYLFDIPGRS